MSARALERDMGSHKIAGMLMQKVVDEPIHCKYV